ncbi:MAG: SufS family cysteine desulfurase [Chlamydiales bacterium]
MQTALDLRKDFPLLQRPLLYFDAAATTPKPQVVLDAMHDYYTNFGGTVNRAVYSLAREATHAYGKARGKVAQFIGASSEEIIFTRNCTAAINLLARSFGRVFLREGDAILISQTEHHSNIVPWQMICEERGARLLIAPVDEEGVLIWDEFIQLLTQGVKLVSIAHVANVTGVIHPIAEIAEAAHAVGARIAVDGAQAVAHFSIDVRNIDFYVFSGHKMYGPTGIGVLYGKKELLEKMPPVEGGGDMIETVTFAKTTYNMIPFKFEAGTPMIAEAIGLKAAVEYLEGIGMEQVIAHEKELIAYAKQKLSIQRLGRADALISFLLPPHHPLDVATLLDCRGICLRSGHHCSQPTMQHFGVDQSLRLSFGLYNTIEEIDALHEALQEVAEALA